MIRFSAWLTVLLFLDERFVRQLLTTPRAVSEESILSIDLPARILSTKHGERDVR